MDTYTPSCAAIKISCVAQYTAASYCLFLQNQDFSLICDLCYVILVALLSCLRMGEVVAAVTSSSGGGEIKVEKSEKKETEEKQGSLEVVRWEKYLPRMVPKVLLVEADDST